MENLSNTSQSEEEAISKTPTGWEDLKKEANAYSDDIEWKNEFAAYREKYDTNTRIHNDLMSR